MAHIQMGSVEEAVGALVVCETFSFTVEVLYHLSSDLLFPPQQNHVHFCNIAECHNITEPLLLLKQFI